MYLLLGGLGLQCFVPAFFIYGEQGLLFVVVCELLIVVAPLVAERGLQGPRAEDVGLVGEGW